MHCWYSGSALKPQSVQAVEAITALRSAVDTLIIIPNDKLLDGVSCFIQHAAALGLLLVLISMSSDVTWLLQGSKSGKVHMSRSGAMAACQRGLLQE